MSILMDVICPTWNNQQFLDPMVKSMHRIGFFANGRYRLIIVNNGEDELSSRFKNIPNLIVINAGKNLGWEGGLNLGLSKSDAKFVCFQNDDVFIPTSNQRFYENLLWPMHDTSIGIVGPVTTVAAGIQSVYHPDSPVAVQDVRWLIGFTMLVRREALDKSGGIDMTLPGGDDFDLSIRMRESGYRLVIQPSAFLIHHGFKTGTRVYGDQTVDGGWNSQKMSDTTNLHLIRKHGFKKFFDTMAYQIVQSSSANYVDLEGDVIRQFIKPGDKVLEVGCGPKKTVSTSIGVDRIGNGDLIPNLSGEVSTADIISDASAIPMQTGFFDVVIARHILEHIVDTTQAISEWKRLLKPRGKLIIAVPDEDIISSIPLNPEHVHAFTKASLASLMRSNDMAVTFSESSNNGVSCVCVARKASYSNGNQGLDRLYEGDLTTIPIPGVIA